MKSILSDSLFWLKNARLQALPQSQMPAILALILAIPYSGFSLPLGVLAIVGVALGHLGLNLFDDYFDYIKKKTDYREELQHRGFRARIGKCKYLTDGSATLKQLLVACCAFSGLALIVGLILFYFRGTSILYFILLTGIMGVSYSGYPLRFSYRGLGELLIGIMFGPMTMLGVFYAACGMINPMIVFVSIPVGLLVANIVYVHSILDFEPDKEVNKHTLAVLLDNKKWMLIALFAILFLPYAIIFYGIVREHLSIYYLLLVITLPMAIYLFYMMSEFVKNPERRFIPQPWMGSMANWTRIEASGVDWFMIRWYLARNLLSFFCIIIIAISFISYILN